MLETLWSFLGYSDDEETEGHDDETIGRWKLGKVIGRGTFGVVRLGEEVSTGLQVAVKIIEQGRMDRKALERETTNQLRVDHANVVKIYDIIELDGSVYIVMEYVPGELFSYVLGQGKLADKEAADLFSQIVYAVDHCHQAGIVHRDLKPENILLDKDNNAKLADFGFATQWKRGSLLTDSCGSPNYAAPELLYKNCKYEGPEVDVWSLGVILYVLLTNELPFDAEDLAGIFKVIKRGQFRMPGYIGLEAQELIKGMLEVDPKKRFTMSQVRNHKWMGRGRSPSPLCTGASKGLAVESQLLKPGPMLRFAAVGLSVHG